MRNLQYPLPWDSIFDYIGFPAFLKPFDGGGWKDVYKVSSPGEFFDAYDRTRDLCMTLQTAVKFKEYFRCYCVGQQKVHIMQYDPAAPFHTTATSKTWRRSTPSFWIGSSAIASPSAAPWATTSTRLNLPAKTASPTPSTL